MKLDVLFEKNELIPAILQNKETGMVLMLAYMNREALEKTIKTRQCTFYSRSRNKIWVKGEVSGNFQMVEDIFFDCDCDTLLIKVTPRGPACHTGHRSCFFRDLEEYIEYVK